MNWLIFFAIMYGIYTIAAIIITFALYLRMLWIDLENEEKGIYQRELERRHYNSTQGLIVLIFVFIATAGTAQNHYGYKITITNNTTHRTQLIHTVSNSVVDRIVVSYFAPATYTFNSKAYFSNKTTRYFDFTANENYMYCEKRRVKTTKNGKLKFLKLK